MLRTRPTVAALGRFGGWIASRLSVSVAMRNPWIVGAALALSAVPVAMAQTPAAGTCKLAALGSGTVAGVVDGRTLTFADGREVRLAAIEVAPPADAAGAAAKDALAALVMGQAIELRGAPPETDRYGRLFAHAFVTRDNKERWVEAELVERGHARVSGRIGERACATALLARERTARAAKLGLWADPYYVVRRAEDAAAVAAERGRFAIVEGKVISVRESGGTIYVNFGRRWSQDFTVTISKRNERSFAGAGLEPKRLEGRRVRVRGWIEQRGGPWVEATRPEQIELAERN
jgi:endonuclease YncB( thermonuclease family)